MNSSLGRPWALLLFSAFAFAPGLALAYSYVMMGDEALFDGAQGVVKAQVAGVLPVADGDIETYYALRIVQTLAGAPVAEDEVLAMPGTFAAPGVDFVAPGVPRLQPGSTVVLFHHRRADGVLQASQLSLGLFVEARSAAGRYYLRSLQGSREFGARSDLQRFHAPRDAAAFEHWLIARGEGHGQDISYLREEVALPVADWFATETIDADAQALVAGSVQAGQVLSWRLGAGKVRQDIAGAETALRDALAVWNGSAPAGLRLQHDATLGGRAACSGLRGPLSAESFGEVCLDDPAELIGGHFEGGGSLAVSGFFAAKAVRLPHAGGVPRRALVLLQDGAAGYLHGDEGVELLAHEIGQALGLDPVHDGTGAGSLAAQTPASGAVPLASPGNGRHRGSPREGQKGLPRAPAPTNLTAFADGTTVLLQWDRPADPTGILFYRVEQCEGAGCVSFIVNIQTTTGDRFDSILLAPSTPHRFRVFAVGTGGFSDSEYSNIVEVTTGTDAPVVMPLTNGVPVPNLSGTRRARLRFSLDVPVFLDGPAGATNLQFRLAGGTGDADLFVRAGAQATALENDCTSNASGNEELCTIAAPASATWFVLVEGFAEFAGVTLTGSFVAPGAVGACEGDCVFRNGFEN